MSVRQTRSAPPTIRASSRSTAPDVDDVVDDDDDEPDADRELELFVRRPPQGADRLLVVAITHQGDQIVQDRSATEARLKPLVLTRSTMQSCERWARVDGRVTKFRATWQRQDSVLSAHQWQCGDGKDPTALDGTVESFLAQHQRHAEAQQRLHLEGFGMVQESWKSLLSTAHRRIEALEKDNEILRDRLRAADDTGHEIALETAKSELEQRGRTTDLIENRVLPIVQAMMLKQLEAGPPPPSAAAASAGKGDRQ